MIGQLLGAAAALALYPGFVISAVMGATAELAWSRLRRRPRPALGSLTGPLPAVAAILGLLAAAQVAAPFNPLPAGDRNALVAAMALLAAGSLLREQSPGLLLPQLCWLLAVLLPAIVPENLRPQVLGAALFLRVLPLKVVCAAIYVACLPALLEIEAPRPNAARALLWLPYCGLLASIIFQPAGDDLLGLARFWAETVGVGVVGIGFALVARRLPRRSLRRLGIPAAAVAVAIAVVTVVMR